MEQKTIKKDSLGVRLATVYGGLNLRWEGHKTDICTLRKRMMFGVLKITVFSTAIALMIAVLGFSDLFAWLTWMAVHMQYVDPSESATGLALGIGLATALVGIGVLICCIINGVLWYRKSTEDGRAVKYVKPKEPSVFVLAYKSWKEKMCYPVTIEK